MRFDAPRKVVAIALVITAAATPALAGPPLLCHPFQIGSARSLPWDGSTSWFAGKAGYDLHNLVADTEALLDPSVPVIVRMETVRRAAIYASRDEAIAADLLKRLGARTAQAGTASAYGYLDFAYLVGAYRQLAALDGRFHGRTAHLLPLVAKLDAYALVRKSLLLKPEDSSLEFAAALIAADTNRAAYEAHARRARAGAPSDKLLAMNIGAVRP